MKDRKPIAKERNNLLLQFGTTGCERFWVASDAAFGTHIHTELYPETIPWTMIKEDAEYFADTF